LEKIFKIFFLFDSFSIILSGLSELCGECIWVGWGKKLEFESLNS